MMGFQSAPEQLFYDFRLEDHVPDDHLLRQIDRFLDLAEFRRELNPESGIQIQAELTIVQHAIFGGNYLWFAYFCQWAQCEGRKRFKETDPDLVALAKRLRYKSPKMGARKSLSKIGRELTKAGILNEWGLPFNHKSVR